MSPVFPRHARLAGAQALAAACCLLLAVSAQVAGASEADSPLDPPMARFQICYDYGCATREQVRILRSDFAPVRAMLEASRDAADERARLADAIGMMEQVVGSRTPTRFDMPGNGHDRQGRGGQMDCVDEATNASAYLRVFEYHGLLRWHRVLSRIQRAPLIFNVHYAAQIEEKATARRFAVDSWFRANGAPAVIQPVEEWSRDISFTVPG